MNTKLFSSYLKSSTAPINAHAHVVNKMANVANTSVRKDKVGKKTKLSNSNGWPYLSS